MSVLDRSALTESPLADLHAIASELSIDGFRRLRREELIDAIVDKQGGSPDSEPDSGSEEPAGGGRRRRGRRGGRGAADGADAGSAADTDRAAEPEAEQEAEEAPKPRRSRSRARKADEEAPPAEAAAEPAEEERPARARRGRGRAAEERVAEERAQATAPEDENVEGTVEVLPNGSGFVRLGGSPEDDVYISSAQVKRCELVTGDTISGPRRAPRRSERFASMIRIETINGRPASEQADTVRFDDLPAELPAQPFELSDADGDLKPIQSLTPFGRGSRVTITGASRSGKSALLRRIAAALADEKDLTVSVALAGVRPEEAGAWSADGGPAPAATVSFAASEDARVGALEPVVDQARRLAARGGHVAVLIDTLDGLGPHAARKLTVAARNLTGGGSVTIIATATEPVGGETTVIALERHGASTGRFPALDVLASGTLHPERLVGESAAKKLARERAKALKD
ncbi:MAG TPA: Rho termination factor N-terminal domain-containing protein [Solirubrobacteraceae bacterium]|nr:Rho termination factor N-terminal domain-containing protein [Solirubrobacteraceae bacterium]